MAKKIDSNKKSIKLLALVFIVSVIWAFVAYITLSSRVEALKYEKYSEVSQKMKNELEVLIDEKKEATLVIALAMAYNSDIKKSLVENSNVVEKLNLEDLALNLSESSSLKHIWFQLITADGKSFYRSWTKKVGDDLKGVRLDIAQMIKNPHIITSISTGKFDLTFKSMVPIYNKGTFIGMVEVLAKFNSVAMKMENKKYDMVVLVDKKYKAQLTHAFTKNFLDEYYVVNLNAKKELLDFVHKKSVEFFINSENFYISKETNHLVTCYKLPDIYGKPMAYFLMFHDLKAIDISSIVKTRDNLSLFFILVYLFIIVLLYYWYIKEQKIHVEHLNRELEEMVYQRTKELRVQTENLDHLAHHDSLTGLPNRLLFLDRLEQVLKHAKRQKTSVALLFLDLDRFKEVNDTFGHESGDILLKVVTTRLLSCVREEDTVARLGGDEFTIILERVDESAIIKIANSIISSMKQPVKINDREMYTTFSIGISTYPDDGETSNILVRNADTAMYKAKENGKNNYQFYSSKMTELAFERVIMEGNIRQAIQNNEFITYFQPKIDARDGKVIGAEALVRWKKPEFGLVSPLQFISLAEDIGLIHKIDKLVMNSAMQTIAELKAEGLFKGSLSLNVSMKELETQSFVEHFETTIQTTGFDAKYLELEITESQIMKNPESAIATLNNIHKLGVRISVDDFGTGYSSLSYLKRLPIDTVKIDRSFVKDAYRDDEDAAIIRVIVALAKSLSLKYIAEGVETQEQLDFLLSEGCYNIQGFFYSKPLPADEFREFLLQRSF